MNKKIKIVIVVVALIMGALAVGWLYFRITPGAWDSFVAELGGESTGEGASKPALKPKSSEGLLASGNIEAEVITVSAEIGGRIVEIEADEGDAVNAGSVLLQLDQEALMIERMAAEAGVEQARAALVAVEAQFELVAEGAGPEAIAAAEVAVQMAQAQIRIAEAGLVSAESLLAQAAEEQLISAETGVAIAQAQVEIAEHSLISAETQLSILLLGAKEQELRVAEAQIAQARATFMAAQSAVEALNAQLRRATLFSPIDGIILQRLVHKGETAIPGAPLFRLANLDQVTLTVYVPEADLGRVSLGQEVEVTVDAYDQVFMGKVSHIASRAEFTPKNVQTQEERVHMVFAVKIKLDNDGHKLKLGMPADAIFRAYNTDSADT